MAGKMRNCSSCGKVFVSINDSRICMDCRAKEEEWEKEIITYVRENPKSTIAEIVEATGAQEPLIRRMIRASWKRASNSSIRARSAAHPSSGGSTVRSARRQCARS